MNHRDIYLYICSRMTSFVERGEERFPPDSPARFSSILFSFFFLLSLSLSFLLSCFPSSCRMSVCFVCACIPAVVLSLSSASAVSDHLQIRTVIATTLYDITGRVADEHLVVWLGALTQHVAVTVVAKEIVRKFPASLGHNIFLFSRTLPIIDGNNSKGIWIGFLSTVETEKEGVGEIG